MAVSASIESVFIHASEGASYKLQSEHVQARQLTFGACEGQASFRAYREGKKHRSCQNGLTCGTLSIESFKYGSYVTKTKLIQSNTVKPEFSFKWTSVIRSFKALIREPYLRFGSEASTSSESLVHAEWKLLLQTIHLLSKLCWARRTVPYFIQVPDQLLLPFY